MLIRISLHYVEKCRPRTSCDITAVFGLLRDTAVTHSYKKKGPRRIGFFRDTRKISFGDFIY